ncbi:phage terminase small subunit [Pseudoalteromonas obscura]|uniref:Phage terminase small subunit n=1 Tax=Pseudoalteromonas obscura TaxID=3048491 RepID=A0ABT7ES89_9GAMM|nr:phage terminase small subunit [Pseudoalteromonas sp. P94(2023)]MDK2597908.1 phage terminase small subunit [Pseudoalteromonas sp. P94(2023)]
MHLQLVELDTDLKRLKGFARIADKVIHKRDVLLPKWVPIVDEYLSKKEYASDNPIFAYCVVWLFDIGNFERAIELALRAIELDQPTPPKIKRGWPGFLSDTVFDWCQDQSEKGRSVEPYFSQVFELVVHRWKLPEKVTAKYYKFAGLALLRDKNGDVKPSHIGDLQALQQADAYLAKAAELHKHAQVKTIRNKIEMRIRALADLQAQ